MLTLPRALKQAAMLSADILAYGAGTIVAVWLVTGLKLFNTTALILALLAICLAIPVHALFGLYTSIVRYMGGALFVVGARATFVISTVTVLSGFLIGRVAAPIRLWLTLWALTLILVVGIRYTARVFLSRSNRNREKVIIYGGGDAGAQLTASLFVGDDFLPVALIDDNVSLHGKRIQGVTVYHPDALQQLVESRSVSRVLLAIPSATRKKRREVLERLSEYRVRIQTVPKIGDIVSGKAGVDEIHDIDVDDLLTREAIPPNPELMHVAIAGKSVMVTGAGGSIGSELCRQILRQGPRRLVCLEISEEALYRANKDLQALAREEGIDSEVVPLLGSVRDHKRVLDSLATFGVETLFHSAAYKHVPIVEQNPFEGIRNNVFGTLHTARAAIEAGVSSFVLVSTDKAVNPTSVMGASKRLAELVLQAFNQEATSTRFSIVRFGNVLESSGSVVPLFREQIKRGGPVTVTHRDVIRYFMTIPEAAQLVIQAGAMSRGGDVFVLDMGEPVRIDDLARRMINLTGLTEKCESHPDGDIEIEYTGLRPAEKLAEELLIGTNVSGTEHPRIMRAKEDLVPYSVLMRQIGFLNAALAEGNHEGARRVMLDTVKEYAPVNGIDDLLFAEKTGTDGASRDGTVVDFPIPD